jgi:hypothetical protein
MHLSQKKLLSPSLKLYDTCIFANSKMHLTLHEKENWWIILQNYNLLYKIWKRSREREVKRN